jgi:hypothetical protein
MLYTSAVRNSDAGKPRLLLQCDLFPGHIPVALATSALTPIRRYDDEG